MRFFYDFKYNNSSKFPTLFDKNIKEKYKFNTRFPFGNGKFQYLHYHNFP